MQSMVTEKHSSKLKSAALLVVDTAPSLATTINSLATEIQCRVLQASSIREAKNILAKEEIDVLLTETNLPDGSGLSLVSALHKRSSTAAALITSSHPSVDDLVNAMRNGAIDFLPKTAPKAQLAQRLRNAIQKRRQAARNEKRLDRLSETVKKLSEAKRYVGKKIDLLCNDLVQAYGTLSKQMDSVRIQEDFRKCICDATDLEQLLCHAMDWLMRQIGYTNIAVWMVAGDSDFELGAYVKYNIASNPDMIAAMKIGLTSLTLKHGQIHLTATDAQQHLSAIEKQTLANQAILSTACSYLGEPLAVITLFRDDASPFTADDAATMQMIAPLFASALSNSAHQPAAQDDEDEQPSRERDADDWWKTGGPAPF